MRIFYSDHHTLPLSSGHRFPADKYRILREKLIADGIVDEQFLSMSTAATDEQLLRIHTREYFESIVNGTIDPKAMRRIGFPWSPELVVRSRHSTGATIAAAQTALREKLGINLAGGTHHSFADCGEGYCVFNDVACAVRELQVNYKIGQILVIDCDVHQGNGTASIFQQDSSVFTFSIHGAKNFPLHKEKSDLDIALGDGTEDDQYLAELERGLEECFQRCKPEFIFYLAGADPFYRDRFGKMKLTKAGLMKRDELVLGLCSRKNLPVAISMAGGYALDLNDIAEIQSNTVRLALQYSPEAKSL
ncbi:histone deacetylase [Rubinisphaera sp.]|uniref:histone deacetylase family protein n=1 Tax=Rubinisphaera sp. TaxID=2024857 RepID=UPI000C0D7192|nr:histone deacetylase [Rubinisphaera sp.]MBV09446.1 histone deacetylase [Rubinisphaera sp.]HCS52821.1 histone deacetylase [Planctomycetaceae bacterium]|tara:strand:- start:1316 stop:2230 length:915 start_codon:yes stop_codon:yes gene_type:complete